MSSAYCGLHYSGNCKLWQHTVLVPSLLAFALGFISQMSGHNQQSQQMEFVVYRTLRIGHMCTECLLTYHHFCQRLDTLLGNPVPK